MPAGARLVIKIVPKYLQPATTVENVAGVSDDKHGLSIQVVMNVRVVQILKNVVVVCEANSCEQTSLDPVDNEILHWFVRNDLGN